MSISINDTALPVVAFLWHLYVISMWQCDYVLTIFPGLELESREFCHGVTVSRKGLVIMSVCPVTVSICQGKLGCF